LKRLSGGFIFV